MSAPELHKAVVLKDLPIRRDPHWGPPLARGRHVGYRKLSAEAGTWIARYRDGEAKMRFHSLGAASPAFQFDEAKAAALEWFKTQDEHCSAGAAKAAKLFSVADACRESVAAKRAAYEADLKTRGIEPFKGEQPNWKDAEGRFARTVYDTPFGARALAKLTTADIKKWRADLGLSEASQNRTLTAFRAAFNLAIEDKHIPASRMIEMRNVKQHKGTDAGGGRELPFLDLQQRRSFLAACGEGDFYDFVLAHILTGARPGELARMYRRQFDSRTKSATFIGKTRRTTAPRTVPLSAEAVALFASRALRAKPGELLFTNAGRAWIHYEWDALVRAAANAAKSPPGTVLYCFRHSWITQSLMENIPVLIVAKLTGTSVAMIEKHYGHLVADRAREEINSVSYR